MKPLAVAKDNVLSARRATIEITVTYAEVGVTSGVGVNVDETPEVPLDTAVAVTGTGG